jgi:hypothetical protein
MKKRLIKKITDRPVDALGRRVYVAVIGRGPHAKLKRRVCRLDALDSEPEDPITAHYGVSSMVYEIALKADQRDGCPNCVRRWVESRMP